MTRRVLLRGGAALGVGLATPIAGAVPSASPARASAWIRLARNGATRYRIYLGSAEGPAVRKAADELASYLRGITAATFEVTVAAEPPDTPYLLVLGRQNPLAAKASTGIEHGDLGEDGFALRTDGPTVFIAGANPRGTLYGTYWVLDRVLGVRWFAADTTRVPEAAVLDVPATDLNGDHVPRFRYRQIYAGEAADPAYRQHNLLNGARGWEGVDVQDGLDSWSTYWPADPFGGNFHEMVPDQSLWYGGQLLCMDPRTRELAAQSLVDKLRERITNGEDPSYGFEQQDTGWSPDPASQQFADQHGGALSAPIMDMVDEVLGRVREQVPEARLSTQAYQFSLPAPTGISVADGVVMTVAPIHANFAESLFSGDNAEIGGHIRTWCEIGGDVVLWDYLTDFASYIQPYPDWWAMASGIKELARHPAAQGYFGESAYNAIGSEFANLRIWVLGRLLWDPTLDVDALIREFLGGYYGPAANLVYRYLQLMTDAVHKSGAPLTFNGSVRVAYFDFDTMRATDDLMANAATTVGSHPQFRRHLQAVRLGVDYVILMRGAEYQRLAAERGIDWDPDTQNRLHRFEAEIKAAGLTQYNEAGGTPEELLTLARIASAPAIPPAVVAGLPDSDWADYQEAALRLYAPVTTVTPDDSASNGYRVAMPGDRPDWGVQLPLDSLPTHDTWKLYVALRADTGTAGPDAAVALAGVWPPFGNERRILVSDLAASGYAEITLPGTYVHDPDRYAYIAPPNSPDIAAVYVDRIFAVKV